MKKIPINFRLDFLADFLNTRTPREKLMFVTFGLVFLLFLDYIFWLSPATQSLTRTLPTLSSLGVELSDLKEDKKNQLMIQKKWEEVRNELADKEKGFEVSDQLPALLENLSKLAVESGVRITSLKPIEVPVSSSKKLYFSVPVQIHATATTHELGNFLSKLETGVSFFKITNLKIASTTTDLRRHSAEMLVETYRKV